MIKHNKVRVWKLAKGFDSPIATKGPINHIKAISPITPRNIQKDFELKKNKNFFILVSNSVQAKNF